MPAFNTQRVCDLFTPTQFASLLEAAEMSAATSWETDFVTDLQGRHEKYGDKMYLTDAQVKSLRSIADR